MLAVVSLPHGRETTLAGAATLSQALLIQPGRALKAELQVRSSFRESLQLHMQLRVAQKSSMPTNTTEALAASGTSIMRRKVVLREVSIPKQSANRTPPLPQ